MTTQKKYVLRQSTEADIDPICEFLVENWHAFNAKRRIEALVSAIKLRRIFLLEELAAHKIHAVSAIFDHLGKYWQAGMSRVSSGVGGFGINEMLHRARAVHAYLIDQTYIAYFVAIEASNTRSIKNSKSVGFQDWVNPPPQLRYQAITQSDKNLKFYTLPIEQIYQFAQWMLDQEEQIRLSRTHRETKKEETITVSLKVESLIYYQDQVKKIAQTGK